MNTLRLLVGRISARGLLAQLLELAGFALIGCGVYRLAGFGVALIVGGILLALLAFEVER